MTNTAPTTDGDLLTIEAETTQVRVMSECAGCGIWGVEPFEEGETPMCNLCLDHFSAFC